MVFSFFQFFFFYIFLIINSSLIKINQLISLAVIVGFHVKISKEIKNLAKQKNVEIFEHDVIYHVISFSFFYFSFNFNVKFF